MDKVIYKDEGEKLKSMQQIIETVLADTQPAALAIVDNVEGSSYRKEGMWMLIQERGVQIGMISGGCVENESHSHATQLFRKGKATTVQYDLSSEDDLGWGRGAGCNGVVTVWIRH